MGGTDASEASQGGVSQGAASQSAASQTEAHKTPHKPVVEGRRLRAIGERYKEQIAEDVVWDIIDEVDFFSQDGGWEYKGEAPQDVKGSATPRARGFANPDDNLGVEVGRRY